MLLYNYYVILRFSMDLYSNKIIIIILFKYENKTNGVDLIYTYYNSYFFINWKTMREMSRHDLADLTDVKFLINNVVC